MRVPVLCPEHAAPPSLPSAAPLPSTPSAAAHHSLVRALHRYYERVRLLIRSLTDCPLGFPPRPGIASATAGRMRSPRFRRLPFVGLRPRQSVSASQSSVAHIAFGCVNGLGLCDIVTFAAQ